MAIFTNRLKLINSVPTSAIAIIVATQLAATGSAFAQSATSSPADEQVNDRATDYSEIVVSARKKKETLLEVPLAITAFSSAEIEKRNVQDLVDVASFTPSLNVSSYGNSTSQRSQQTVIIRGMTPASSYSNTTTVFLNGAPLGGAGLIDGISDVAQIEIVKGPQSAYFGRATFAGAVNIITRAPGDEFKASFDALYGSYNWVDLKATVEGAIIPGILKARITGRHYAIDGQYRIDANPGYAYGAQSSKNLLGEIEFTPSSNLKVRAFGAYMVQDDGLSPLAKFTTPSFNCNPGGQNFICGKLPIMDPLGPNTSLPPAFYTALQSPAAAVRYKDLGLDHVGSASEILIGTMNVDWQIPDSDLTLSSVTAANRTLSDSNNDLSNEYRTATADRNPFDTYNYAAAFSQEVRLTTDQTKRLRGLIGANYQWQRTGQTNMGITQAGNFLAYAPSNINRNKALGFFGNVSFDVTEQVIVNLEGRYQIDKSFGFRRLARDGEAYEEQVPGLEATTKKFLPRAILQYKFLPDMQLYASYSKGTNPGLFNAALLSYSQALRDEVYRLTGAGIAVTPESINNYEIGYKGNLFNNRLQVELGIYYAKWRNQLISQTIYIDNFALTGINGPAVFGTLSNLGSTDLKGIEASLFFRLADGLTGSAGGSINDSKINSYANAADAQVLGIVGAPPLDLYEGNQLANYSKYSANVALDYNRALTDDLDGFVHVDYFYKSRMYNGPANLVWTPDTHNVNARVGTEFGQHKLELFVENLTNNKAYNGITSSIDINRRNQRIVYGSLPTPRRFGIRLHFEY
ncbi:MAG: TonB-dependent receptor [Sphingobium sp.]